METYFHCSAQYPHYAVSQHANVEQCKVECPMAELSKHIISSFGAALYGLKNDVLIVESLIRDQFQRASLAEKLPLPMIVHCLPD